MVYNGNTLQNVYNMTTGKYPKHRKSNGLMVILFLLKITMTKTHH